ncbi:MAG: NAD(P)-dependent dehydrogenase (short-subunit alcohol dehydrogenase family) [Planctomycetota bacterium]|jgi:NAD(P)-dependent dehydrogenase (short-subunit alcohol dehydrogenase family)
MATTQHRLAGRHVLVTGAGTGIGRAIALRLAEEGASLSLLARDATRLAQTAADCASDAVHVASCDIRDKAALDAAMAAAVAVHGPLYAAIANAGVGGGNEPGPEDRFDDLVSTNLNGTYYTFRAAQEHLMEGPGPRHLVSIASILGRIGVPGYSGYCASKAGLGGLVRSLAAELGLANVQVNAICPGWVNTAMAHEGIDGMAQGMGVSVDEATSIAMSAVPMGRMSEPEDVAGMVAWLISPDARGVTGQCLDINGGAFML